MGSFRCVLWSQVTAPHPKFWDRSWCLKEWDNSHSICSADKIFRGPLRGKGVSQRLIISLCNMSLAKVSSRGFGEEQGLNSVLGVLDFCFYSSYRRSLELEKPHCQGGRAARAGHTPKATKVWDRSLYMDRRLKENLPRWKMLASPSSHGFPTEMKQSQRCVLLCLSSACPLNQAHLCKTLPQLLTEECLRVSELLLRLSAGKEPDVIRFKLITQAPNLH